MDVSLSLPNPPPLVICAWHRYGRFKVIKEIRLELSLTFLKRITKGFKYLTYLGVGSRVWHTESDGKLSSQSGFFFLGTFWDGLRVSTYKKLDADCWAITVVFRRKILVSVFETFLGRSWRRVFVLTEAAGSLSRRTHFGADICTLVESHKFLYGMF